MEIKGKVIQVLETQQGEGKNGTWLKGGFVIETDGKYPKKVMIEVWNDNIDTIEPVGINVTVQIEAESREYNGRWYTGLKAWRIEGESAPQPGSGATATATPVPNPNVVSEDDLPF